MVFSSPLAMALTLAMLAVLVVGGAAFAIRRLGRRRATAPAFALTPDLETAQSAHEAMDHVVRQVGTWVQGTAAHGYWLDAHAQKLNLLVPARLGDDGSAPESGGAHTPGLDREAVAALPPQLDLAELPAVPRRIRTPAGHWLDIPFGHYLLVRVQLPPGRQVPRRLLHALGQAAVEQTPLVVSIYRWAGTAQASANGAGVPPRRDLPVRGTNGSLDTQHDPLALLLRVGAQIVSAHTFCAVVAVNDQPEVLSDTDEGRAIGQQLLRGDAPAVLNMSNLPDVIAGANLGPLGQHHNACVRVPVVVGTEALGCFFYFVSVAATLSPYRTAALRTLGERAAYALGSDRGVRPERSDYEASLRSVVEILDGLSPCSAGHSARMARLAGGIATEMGLAPGEVEGIATAAYFHDVGMMALAVPLTLKPGPLTAGEYELVKTHTELGACLVEPLGRTQAVAALVSAHHERWDGGGYPHRLQGADIPLGARIIAVADFWESRTTGRSYRSPLPFDHVLAEVRQAAGIQLDPEAVAALVGLQKRTQLQASAGLPMDRCWEIKQLPEKVCRGCPNRVARVVRCWDHPGKLCTRHGDVCDTCIVYTEAQSRLHD